MEAITAEELEAILARVESGETTGADADRLREVLRVAGLLVLPVELKRLSETAARQRKSWRSLLMGRTSP